MDTGFIYTDNIASRSNESYTLPRKSDYHLFCLQIILIMDVSLCFICVLCLVYLLTYSMVQSTS